MRIRSIATAAVLVMAMAGPAGASHTPPGEPFVPEYIETPTFLHCNGATKLSNVHALVEGNFVQFNTTAPTASYTTGAGCGTVETFVGSTVPDNPAYDFPVEGTFTGNIKNLTVRFWAIDLAGSRALEEFTVDLSLAIDGETILTHGTDAHAPTIASSTGISRLYEVTVTNIGLGTEEDHEEEHTIQLTAATKFVDGSGILVWVYDASEIDSGLVINDTTPSSIKIPRNA
ncbi:MAG: hypothetical protein ACRDH9_06025 [Actinomycetota bacterium]